MDDSHITAEALELYALGRLSEPEGAAVEEHLLICEHCQEALALDDGLRPAQAGKPDDCYRHH